jgi:uncharacterized membrane protein YphA (DoxX/SURF4 family)
MSSVDVSSAAGLPPTIEGTVRMTRLRAWWPWLGLFARLVVGTVWIVAGELKVRDLEASTRAVRNFRVLPEAIVPFVGHLLPLLEITVGALLIVGFAVPAIAAISALIQLAFIIGIAQAWARGFKLDCGCFGGGGAATGNATRGYVLDIARDTGLLALSVLLVVLPRTRWAADTLIWSPRESNHGE